MVVVTMENFLLVLTLLTLQHIFMNGLLVRIPRLKKNAYCPTTNLILLSKWVSWIRWVLIAKLKSMAN